MTSLASRTLVKTVRRVSILLDIVTVFTGRPRIHALLKLIFSAWTSSTLTMFSSEIISQISQPSYTSVERGMLWQRSQSCSLVPGAGYWYWCFFVREQKHCSRTTSWWLEHKRVGRRRPYGFVSAWWYGLIACAGVPDGNTIDLWHSRIE